MRELVPTCDPEGVYSVKRTCAELGVSYKTLRKYKASGLIKPLNPDNASRPKYSGQSIIDCWKLLTYPMISELTINKVRELSIEDVLEPYVRLSRKGSTLMGVCPFHEERTGSFSVSPGKNLFHCFSCNRGGDAITFIMEKENLSFMEAIEFFGPDGTIFPLSMWKDRTRSKQQRISTRKSFLPHSVMCKTFL